MPKQKLLKHSKQNRNRLKATSGQTKERTKMKPKMPLLAKKGSALPKESRPKVKSSSASSSASNSASSSGSFSRSNSKILKKVHHHASSFPPATPIPLGSSDNKKSRNLKKHSTASPRSKGLERLIEAVQRAANIRLKSA